MRRSVGVALAAILLVFAIAQAANTPMAGLSGACTSGNALYYDGSAIACNTNSASPFPPGTFGDGSDGAITISSGSIDYPDSSGVSAWQASHAYSVGDLVKSTGTYVRVYQCIVSGTSGLTDPFTDGIPGAGTNVYGFTLSENSNAVFWKHLTKMKSSTSEGMLYASSFTVNSGQTFYVTASTVTGVTSTSSGFPLYVSGALTVNSTGSLTANGRVSATDIAVPSSSAATVSGSVWSIAISGAGGTTTGGNAGSATSLAFGGRGGNSGGNIGGRPGVQSPIRTIPRNLWLLQPDVDTLFNFSGGAGGAGDGANKGGGGGGGAGALLIFAKTITNAGTISANGGAGAAGQGGTAAGGGGGGGGLIYLVTTSYTNSGTVTASGGGAGSGGSGAQSGTDGLVVTITP